MSRNLIVLCVLLAALSACSDSPDRRAMPGDDPGAGTSIRVADLLFPDQNLADCVSRSAATNGWTFTDEVTALDCANDFEPERAIRSLEGLEVFAEVEPPKLSGINFKFNAIRDATPLSGLTGLTVLELGGWSGNRLTDLSFLAGLRQLTVLSLHSDEDIDSFSDISILGQLTQLETLLIEGAIYDFGPAGKVSDITALTQLTNLRILAISGQSDFADLSPLGGLFNLVELNLSDNGRLADLAPLAGLTELQKLDVSGSSSIEQLDALSTMTGLAELVVGGFLLRDLTPISQLPDLRSLEVYDSGVSDIGPLANLQSLEVFRMQNLDDIDEPYLFLKDVSPLSRLPRLTTLAFNYNIGMDISVIGEMRQLRRLDLADNQLEDVQTLAGLVDLVELELAGNRLADIRPLATLTGLERLDLRRNPELSCGQITDLAASLPDTDIEADGCEL